jgi:PhzF family phenazine biosynthesis protein
MRFPPVPDAAWMARRSCRLFHVDAFTRERFAGNPAVVVLDADELTDEDMHRIAREINGTEVAFVIPPESTDYDLEVRFFAPDREVAFVGHATVAAQYVRALVNGVPKGRLRQRTGAGIIEVEVEGKAPDLRVSMIQSPATFGPVVPEARRGPVLDALGISSASLHPSCPMQVMVKGGSRLLIGLQSTEMLASLRPQMDQLVHLTPHVGADGFFVFALADKDGAVATESRMFCPVIGVPEDPVSGNAHGMLGVYLVHNGLLAPGAEGACRFVGHQGRFVDRPGRVDVEVTASGRRATAVRVSGDAVIVYQAELPI